MMIYQYLKELVGKPCSVTYSSVPHVAQHYELQVTVHGELENKPGTDSYRIVHPDGMTYAHFHEDDVYEVAPFSGGARIMVRNRKETS